MSFQRPTLQELVTDSEADFISRLSLAGAVLRRSMVRVFARVVAGAAHMLHGHLDYASKQPFPDTADRENLLRIGSQRGVELKEATFATGTVTLTGDDGSIVEAGSVLTRSDGTEYTTDADATIASGTATVAVTASEAGASPTLEAGVELTFQSPSSGVDATATVASSTEDGADEEDIEDYRTRVIENLRSPPQGGSESDYVEWAKEVSGVTRAWAYRQELGPGTVVVRFVRDDDAGSIIPSVGEVATVQAYIDTKRPVTAEVTVVAPVATPQNFTLAITPDTVANRAAVQAELEDLIARTAEPGGTTLLFQIDQAIGAVPAITNFVRSVPAADVTRTTGQLTTMGTITWL
jgi:uncharacterized phage protein gp47/JayE